LLFQSCLRRRLDAVNVESRCINENESSTLPVYQSTTPVATIPDVESSTLPVSQYSTPVATIPDVESSTLPVSQYSTPLSTIPDIVRDATQSLQSDVDVSLHHDKVQSCVTETGSGSGSSSDLVSDQPAIALVSSDVPVSTEISNCTITDVSSAAASHGLKTDSKTCRLRVSDLPATTTAVTSYHTEPGNTDVAKSHESEACTKTSGYLLVANELADVDVETGSKSFSDAVVAQVPSCEITAAHDSTADVKLNSYQVSSVPAADVTSHDTKTSNTKSSTVIVVSSDLVTSQDPEAGAKANISKSGSVPAAAVISRDQEAGTEANTSNVSSVPAAGIISRDHEAGTESTSTANDSPDHYVPKQTSPLTRSLLRTSPWTDRRQVPRTNPVYVVRTSTIDGVASQNVDEVSPPASLTSTDGDLTGGPAAPQLDDSSHERSPSNGINAADESSSPKIHIRHISEPFSVSDAVSMDMGATDEQSSEQSRDKDIASLSSKLLNQHNARSASMPSTPLYVSF